MAVDRDKARIQCIVDGVVQGVGFRMFVHRVARELGLVGYVRNANDARVEVVAEGPRPAIEKLIDLVERGPSMAQVIEIDLEWGTPTGEFTDFTIRR